MFEHHLTEFLRTYLGQHGYITVAIVLLLENAGLPVPGETILVIASILAYKHDLSLPLIIVAGTIGATLGDNIGFFIGHRGGRPLLDRYSKTFRIKPATIAYGEQLFARYGAATVFFARFIAGMRVIAGPLAGVLRMHWKKFAIYNALGAATWVTVISTAGYYFGKHVFRGLQIIGIAGALALVVFLVAWWWRKRRKSN